MKKLGMVAMVALAATWLATGVAFAEEWQGKGETKTVTGIQVEVITPAAGLKVGENNLAVRLKEAAGGQAVVREVVRGDLAMDEGDKSMNHGGMSTQKPVGFELKPVASEQGRYEGKVTLTDPGNWNLRVFTDSRGVGSPASFKVSAEKASAAAPATNSGAAAPQAATKNTAAAPQASGPNWLVLGGLALLVVAGIGGVVARVKKSSAPAPAPAAPVETPQA